MPAHPEHITASHALYLISSLSQIFHIARQCGGIATDIDYPLWLHPDDRVEADAVTAFARRIDDDDIGIDLIFLILPWKYLFSFSDEKLDIFHAI